MHDSVNLSVVLIFLAAAIVVVALFRKLRVSPVLGYLVAGAAIGPSGAGIITEIGGTSAVAEFGIVFLLFIVGLELSWERLRSMRKRAFAVGIAQVGLTTIILAALICLSGQPTKTAIIIGSGLTLSSTAFVMQLITEYNQKASQLGRLSVAVLLLQDLAVVPLLVLVPALAHNEDSISMELAMVALKAGVCLAVIFFAGRIILRPVYRLISSLQNAEIFTALTFLVVLGTGWLTSLAGLSVPLGAFMAGLLLAETEYRHQVEADVMPYKGLFLGLFFMVVGMSVDIHIVLMHFPLILGLAVLLMLVKTIIIIATGRALGFGMVLSLQAGLLLSQGGEFAFIVFGLAADNGFITQELAQILMVVVTFSMALTPFAAAFGRWVTGKIQRDHHRAEESATEMIDIRDHTIILGFGRVGQTVAKLISVENFHYIALDMQIETVARAKKMGLPVYYGDGSVRDVLHAIGILRASAVIITIHDSYAAERAVRTIRSIAPVIPIITRAHNLERVQALEAAGADIAVSEMFETSLQLGGALLKSIGVADQEILRIIDLFRDHDYALARGTLETKHNASFGKILVSKDSVKSGAMIKSNVADKA